MSQDDKTAAGRLPEPRLAPQLDPKWAMGPGHLLMVVLWSIFFVVLTYIPLNDGDVWGHVAFGNWIVQHRALPSEDPFLPLAEGMPLVNSRWLAQVLLALVDRALGPEGLVALLAVTTLMTWLIVWRVAFLRTSQIWTSLLITTLAMAVSWSRWSTVRQENLGMFALAILWWVLESDCDPATGQSRFSLRVWIGIPLLIALWANFDESFLCGPAVVGAFAVEAIWHRWRVRTTEATAATTDLLIRRIWLAEMALLAAAMTPYGMRLVWHGLLASRNANLRDVLEWQPLSFGAAGSYEFVAAWALGIVALRRSRRPLSMAHGLVLALFSLATLNSNRMIGGFAIVWCVTLAPQLSEILEGLWRGLLSANRLAAEGQVVAAPPWMVRTWRYNYVALLVIWCAFALSPTSQGILGGNPRTPAQVYGHETPFVATAYLREHPPQGQIFNPQWWGDWILRDGPPDAAVFVSGNIRQIPHRVWEDYLLISRGQPGWQSAMSRYAVESIVIDQVRMPELDKALRREATWRVIHEDDVAAIFERRAVPAAIRRTNSQSQPTRTPLEDEPDRSEQ